MAMTAIAVRGSKRGLLPLFRQTIAAFNRDNASRFGAALAFYIVFTIAPALLMAISITGIFLGREKAEEEILAPLSAIFGSAASVAITAMVRDASKPVVGWLASSFGLVAVLFGFGGVYSQIDDALRTIWGAEPPKKSGLIGSIKTKIASGALVAGVGAWLLILGLADAAISLTGTYATSRLVGGELLWQSAQIAVSTAVLTLLFASLFRYLPRKHVPWRDVWLGAACTALLFVVGKLGLGLYLGTAAVGSRYGAAGSIVVVLVWAYWSAQIFFFGLELTRQYELSHGDGQ